MVSQCCPPKHLSTSRVVLAYSSHWTLHTLRTVHCILCAPYTVQCILFTLYTAYSSHCTLHTLRTVQCILCAPYTVYSALYILECILYAVRCTLCMLYPLCSCVLHTAFYNCILHTVKQYILSALHFIPWCKSKSLFLVNLVFSTRVVLPATMYSTVRCIADTLPCLPISVWTLGRKNVQPSCHQWATSG